MARARNQPHPTLGWLIIAIVMVLLVLAARAAAAPPMATTDGASPALPSLEASQDADVNDVIERNLDDPHVASAQTSRPPRGPSAGTRTREIEISIGWRRHLDDPTVVSGSRRAERADELWVLVGWSL
ncbi:MAG: hypothetical protein AB7P03_22410 [Kofleriaceae bacterium]